MGQAREAIAFFLLSRSRSLELHKSDHQILAAAVAGGHAYSNAYDLALSSSERFGDLLYNIKSDSRSKQVNTAEDAKALWEQVTGKPWPTPAAKDPEEPSEDS